MNGKQRRLIRTAFLSVVTPLVVAGAIYLCAIYLSDASNRSLFYSALWQTLGWYYWGLFFCLVVFGFTAVIAVCALLFVDVVWERWLSIKHLSDRQTLLSYIKVVSRQFDLAEPLEAKSEIVTDFVQTCSLIYGKPLINSPDVSLFQSGLTAEEIYEFLFEKDTLSTAGSIK